MTNPYAPPRAVVRDIADPSALAAPADRGTRLVASLLDGLIIVVMIYAPLMVAASAGEDAAEATGGTGVNAVVVGGALVAAVGFAVWCWFTILYTSRNGQSIAKKLLGIKVVRTDGSVVSLGRLFWLRNVVNGVISIIPLYALVDALFIFGDSRQCLHDRIAGTIVLKA